MNYSLRQLKVFVTVARARSFSRAGEMIGLSQSAVSHSVKELEHQIHHVKVVEEVQTDVVGIGSYVKVATAGKNLEYQIVGSAEANIKEGKLSNASPVGEGLMGCQAGDVVEIEVPRGVVTYEILDIHR